MPVACILHWRMDRFRACLLPGPLYQWFPVFVSHFCFPEVYVLYNFCPEIIFKAFYCRDCRFGTDCYNHFIINCELLLIRFLPDGRYPMFFNFIGIIINDSFKGVFVRWQTSKVKLSSELFFFIKDGFMTEFYQR